MWALVRMSWIVVFLGFCFCFGEFSEGRLDMKLPSAAIVGTVYCHTCFQEKFPRANHFISGAVVLVECREGISRPSFREEAKTDKNGEFRVHLPFSVIKQAREIEGCSVRLIKSSESFCAVASMAASSSLLPLKLIEQKTLVFSAGFFSFRPRKQPNLCNQRANSIEFDPVKTVLPPPVEIPSFSSPIQKPITPMFPGFFPNFPRIPLLPQLPPLPQLPSLPSLPGLYFPPFPGKNKEAPITGAVVDQKEIDPEPSFPPLLPTDPFESPSFLPQNPFQTPSIIPNPFQSPSLPANPFPQIPTINPSPPSLSTPFPFPFPPVPGISRLHPSSSTKKASP